MAYRKDGSFKLQELTIDELIDIINRNGCAWHDHNIVLELQRRAGDEGYIKSTETLATIDIDILEEWLWELGFDFDGTDEGNIIRTTPITDAEVDAWLGGVRHG